MPVNKLGTATVSVEADATGFGAGLRRKLRTALEGADVEGKRAGKAIGKEIVEGIGDEILRRTPLLRRRINAMLRGISVTARVRVNVEADVDRNTSSRLIARLRGQLTGELAGSAQSAGNGIRAILGNLIPKSLPQLAIYISLFSVLGTVLAGAFNAAGRELLNLVKLGAFLPAGLAVILATVSTLQVAFHGLGDAIGAVFERDPDKLKEALKGLSPSARGFVLELQKALPIFDRIKAAVQESLFAPLKGTLTSIVQNLSGPVTFGMSMVADSIGRLLASVGSVLANPQTQRFIENLFASTSSIIMTLSGPITNLVQALINAANVALPALEKLFGDKLGGFIQRLADWLNAAVEDGRFQAWLDSAERTLSDIWYIIEQLIGLFAVLFDDANNEGESFLRIVGDMIRDFKDFAASKEGKLALDGIAASAKLAGIVLIGLALIIWTIVAAIGSLVGAIKEAVAWIGRLGGAGNNALSTVNVIKKGLSRVPGHADGAIVRRPELATLAEDGPEVVIPLTRPNRARQLAAQSGLTRMLRPEGGGTTIQKFYLGEEEVEARIVEITDGRITNAVTDASYGTRAA